MAEAVAAAPKEAAPAVRFGSLTCGDKDCVGSCCCIANEWAVAAAAASIVHCISLPGMSGVAPWGRLGVHCDGGGVGPVWGSSEAWPLPAGR